MLLARDKDRLIGLYRVKGGGWGGAFFKSQSLMTESFDFPSVGLGELQIRLQPVIHYLYIRKFVLYQREWVLCLQP